MGEKSSLSLASSLCVWVLVLFAVVVGRVRGDDPYRFFTWNVTYGDIYPLGVKQQGILINGQFPGPQIESVTNDNLIINVFNSLPEPFLISWNGVQQRRNSWQDGVYGTNCPIPPGRNFTYVMQVKDQIGSYFYFPSLAFHKAAGGFGGLKILSRPFIPVPFPPPDGDYTLLVGDWFKANHSDLKAILDNGHDLPFPDGILINGRGFNGNTFTVDQGKTYRFRISNVGLTTSFNIRFQGHTMKLVEVEGSHTVQNTYSSLDVHLGQSYSVLLTADQPPRDYYIAVSTRFTNPVISTTSILHYSNSAGSPVTPPPGGPTIEIDWSLNQARSVRWNLTASGPRPNPQGSYHYGMVNTTRTIRIANSNPAINGKQRYAVNSVSFIPADTPLKVADFYNISGVFSIGSIPDNPTYGGGYLQTSVMASNFREYVEIIFENSEDLVQSWHIDGYSFWVVGMDGGQWRSASRHGYNLRDAVSRCTLQARKKVAEALRGMVRRRKDEDPTAERIHRRKDMVSELLEADVSEEEMVDFLVALLVAGYETTSTIITLAVKFLTDATPALQLLQKEHEEIKARKEETETLDWSDYKSMPFTQCVINETLRVANVISGVFRRAETDIHFKGYTIPKGCRVFASFRAVHLDPDHYKDARTFNPWRWQEKDAPQQNAGGCGAIFTPFGGGPRLCPGYELARVEISFFLHYFVTRFRWDVAEEDRLVFFPTTRTLKGYPIRVRRRHCTAL